MREVSLGAFTDDFDYQVWRTFDGRYRFAQEDVLRELDSSFLKSLAKNYSDVRGRGKARSRRCDTERGRDHHTYPSLFDE